MISSVNLLYILLHSWDEGSLMRQLGLGGISYGKITSSIYLKVSVSDFLTLFSARAGGDWFFMVKPAKILLCGAMVALSCSTCFAMFWPKSYPDGIQTEGLVESPPYMLEVFVWSWSCPGGLPRMPPRCSAGGSCTSTTSSTSTTLVRWS